MSKSKMAELENKFNILADDLQITKSRLTEAKRHIKILNQFATFRNRWERNVINPYVSAYSNALTSYNDIIKLDELAEKARLEMAFMVLSLFGGSALTAVLGSVKWGSSIKDISINYICNNNMNKTFKAIHAYSNSPVAQFATGHILSSLKSELGKKVKDTLTTANQSTSYAKMLKPIIVSNNMKDLYTSAEDSVRFALDDLLTNKKGKNNNITARRQALDKLMQSPFCQAPKKLSFVQDTVSKEIELGFFMKSILESDHLVCESVTMAWSKDIKLATTNPKYPKNKPGFGYSETVAYKSLGDAAVKRMYALVKDLKTMNSPLVSGLPVLPIDNWYGQRADKKSFRWAETFLIAAGKRKVGIVKTNYKPFRKVLSKP